jgi:hypothetical protein
MIYGELGACPMSVYIQTRIVNFWSKLVNCENSKLSSPISFLSHMLHVLFCLSMPCHRPISIGNLWLHVTSLAFFVVFLLCYIHHLVMCMQILILNDCIYLCTIVMHWFMRIKNLDLDLWHAAAHYTTGWLIDHGYVLFKIILSCIEITPKKNLSWKTKPWFSESIHIFKLWFCT